MKKLLVFLLLLGGCQITENIQDDLSYKEPTESPAVNQVKVPDLDPEVQNKRLRELQQIKAGEYTIQPGDLFDYYVYDNNDLTAKGVVVLPDGSMPLNLAGVVPVGGKTIAEAVELIEERLAKYIRSPKVSLLPTSIKSSRFTIVGKVGNPGVYDIKNNTRLTDAIAIAQGFSVGERQGDTVEMADLEHAFVIRKGELLPVNFIEAIRNGNYLHNIPLADGDYIYIPSTMNREVFVVGQVEMPGYVGYKERMTLVQAIAYARGRKSGAASDVLVIRGGLVKPLVYRVEVERILRGKALPFMLKPNDIVYVPRSNLEEWNEIIRGLLPTFELLNVVSDTINNLESDGGSD